MERKDKKKRAGDNNLLKGVLGIILSIVGLLFAFKVGAENLLIFLLLLCIIIIGIILVAKAFSD